MSTDSSLLKLTVCQIHSGLLQKNFSFQELFQAHREHIEKYNPQSNALVRNTFSYAEERIKILQQKIDNNENFNLLAGIPLIAKDNYCIKNIKTTACSKMLQDFVPPYTATVLERLENEGMVLIGQANMDEFALGSANQNSYFGDVHNPWIRNDGEQIIPGGSSGGSAVAVASYCAPIALGTDTGGSVRQPAACCGIVGLKPTYGMFSRFGIVTFASTLDQAGIFTRNVDDNIIAFDAMKGFDPKDNSSLNQNPAPIFKKLQSDQNFQNLRVGIIKEFAQINEGTVPRLHQEAIKIFDNHHIDYKEVNLPYTEFSLAAYYTICCAEVYSNMARYDGIRYGLQKPKDDCNLHEYYQKIRNDGFGDEVKLRIMMGNYLLSKKSKNFDHIYQQANKVRTRLIKDFEKAFAEVDILITPIFINSPRLFKGTVNSTEDRLNDTFTSCVNLAGLPGISVPLFKHEDGLPISIQMIAKHGGEYSLFKLAKLFEQEVNFAQNMQEKIFDLCVKN